MLYSIKFLDNEKSYSIYPQIKLVDKFTTELDMFEFTLKPIDEELDLDFTKYNGLIPLVLKANGEDFKIMYLSYYRLVNTQHNPKNFKYMFQTVSPTVKLQRITLPNKLITQPITDNKRTVWEELNKIMEVYADGIGIDFNLEQLMNIPCPELQFVKSTLHEVLITLFAVCGLAPKMDYYNFLSFIDLKSSTNAKNWKSEDLFIREEKSNTIQNYADALDFDIENAIDNEDDVQTQWLSPTSEEVIVSDDNFVWKTPSNIYEIVKVEAIADIQYTKEDAPNDWQESKGATADISKYVLPKAIWETLKESLVVGQVDGEYKRNYLYYDGDTIFGNHSEKQWTGTESTKAIKNVIAKYYLDINFGGLLPNFSSVNVTSNYRDILLRIIYKTQTNGIRVKIVKNGVEKPTNNMISNQEESFIDTINFANQKQELIDRMGNELYVGQARFDLSKYEYLSELNIADLGDRVDNDYIITEREMQFNENSLLVNYKLAKDYIFLTGYSGLNQVKRFTSIDTQNTLIRNDNFLYNYKIEKEDKGFTNDYLINKVINNYGSLSENGLMLHVVKTYDANSQPLQDDFYILVNSQNKVIADSVLCNFKFETNIKAGDSIVKDNSVYLKEPIMYADNNAEFKYLDLYFGAGEWLRNNSDLEVVRKFPRVEKFSVSLIGETYLINKDNREITSISLQFRFVGNNKDVFVYKDFAKYTQITAHNKVNFKIYAKYFEFEEEFNENLYKVNTNKPIGDLVSVGILSVENNKISIKNVATQMGYWVIGVCDENDNLLLAVNHFHYLPTTTIDLFVNKIF